MTPPVAPKKATVLDMLMLVLRGIDLVVVLMLDLLAMVLSAGAVLALGSLDQP